MEIDLGTALLSFFPEQSAEHLQGCVLSPTVGGINNRSWYLADPCSPPGERSPAFVVRLSNNGNNAAAVAYELRVLAELAALRDGALVSLDFRVPESLLPLTLLPSGAALTVFRLIEGALPPVARDARFLEAFGAAAGQLSRALAALPAATQAAAPCPPLHALWRVHHAISRERFFSFLASPQLAPFRGALQFLLGHIERAERDVEALLAAPEERALPAQLIHGDLHHDNVLALDGRVTGVLDFEFLARDWRAVEFAICVSKIVSLEEIALLEAFFRGLARHVALTREEVSAMPLLMILRIVSNVVFFVGRYLAEEDSLSTCTSRLSTYQQRVQWIVEHQDALIQTLEMIYFT